MKKSDIADRVADRIGLSRSAARERRGPCVRGRRRGPVEGRRSADRRIRDVHDKARPARAGRNPLTGESPEIKASTAPTFKPGKALKDAVTDRNAS